MVFRPVALGLMLIFAVAAGACGNDDPSDPVSTAGTVAPSAAAGEGVSPATASSATPTTAAQRRPASGPSMERRQAAPFDPASFQLRLERVAEGFERPTFVTHAGDGSGRMFVVEKAGVIRVIAGGGTLSEPFLDIRSIVGSRGSEQGLLGLAFHPRYAENGRFFVAYTANNTANGDNTVAEYRVSSDTNRADPATGRVLYAIPDFASNHNGGMIAFGPDGYLYAGTGDGGQGGDPRANGQNLGALLGKMLRLDVDGGEPYGIPAGNPCVGRGDARPEAWAYGLRNPWRFSFDRATGELWIADVGQNAREEINIQPATSSGGENYGWNIMEGMRCFQPSDNCDRAGLTLPVHDYGRDQGVSVTGGYVYRGAASPPLYGAYLYGDFGSGRIWALYQPAEGGWRNVELLRPDVQISTFGEDESGEVYLASYGDGAIYRLTAAPR